jgi:predicted dehydrogenase
MRGNRQSRRDFLKTSSLAALAGAAMPYWATSDSARAFGFYAANERPVIGCIGTGDRWNAVGPQAMNFGEVAAVCDVDSNHMGKGRDRVKEIQGKKGIDREVEMHEDYRKVLDRKDIDVVTIVTPDHWHSKIAIEAMKAGKDVYCEKPLTLTIDEGKQIIKVLKETQRVFQVGTQQRSEMGDRQFPQRFLTAIALVHAGRIGKIKKVTCAINGAPTSGVIPIAPVPKELNWDMWLGQAPMVDYRSGELGNNRRYPESRTHYEFRWWYEYSGGKMTDWGAHHVDIAQWAIGMDNSGPVSVQGTAHHPVPMKDGMPTQDDRYNVADTFNVTCQFPNGVELLITSEGENGITFEGADGTFFVSRGKINGAPVDDLKGNPLPDDAIAKLYKGKKPGNHMGNFFECIKDREQPISDVFTHHRSMTTCHLANIAIRLGRKLEWDAEKEQIIGDKDAQQMQAREQRKGYEIMV